MFLYHWVKNHTKLCRKRSFHRFKLFLKYHWDKTEKEPVFILTARRTGSNLLLDYLNSVPHTSFAPEILNRNMFYGLRSRFISKASVLRHIRHSINHCDHRLCGAKLIKVQMETHRIKPGDLLALFPRARFIVLYRRSLLEQFVSLKMAQTSGRWESVRNVDLPPDIRVDIGELRSYARTIRAFYDRLQKDETLSGRCLTLNYEELASDAQGVFDREVFPFLGLPSYMVFARHRKQNTRPLRETIVNFEEIESILDEPWIRMDLTQKPYPRREEIASG